MKPSRHGHTWLRMLAVTVLFSLTGAAAAQNLEGTATNGTTGKPAAGDDVVLISLSQGMSEAARTKTDAKGRFRLDVTDSGAPHLVRVTHQNVNYFRMAPPGTTSVEVQVYDSAKRVEGVATPVQVMRLQADNNSLQVIELWAVNNNSKPPRTEMSDRTFEVVLPEGAHIDSGQVQGPGGQPVNSVPVPIDGKKGHYYFVFPIRPGETRFQVAYHLPYSGQATLTPTFLNPLEHFVVMMPKSMQFSPDPTVPFQPMPDDTGASVQVSSAMKPGQQIAFKVSGTGMLADESPDAQQQGSSEMTGRPGGGLGPPIDAPDPLSRYRWYILGGFGVVLAFSAIFVVTHRSGPAATEEAVEEEDAEPEQKPQHGPALLLEAMKEELFQLEIDRQQGRISPEEYESAKAALDHTLKRALSRTGARTA